LKAVILAGGLGTRLRPLTYTVPKPMLPVANRPLLDHIVCRLAGAGVNRAIVTTNYLPAQISEHVKNAGYPIDVSVIEEKQPLGTAGAIRNVRRKINGTFLVVQGDVISTLDLSEHMKLHRGIATISLTPVENPGAYGIAEVDRKGRIRRFLEKPGAGECFSNLANTGTYVLEPEVIDMMPKGRSDFSFDVFPKILASKRPLHGIVQQGYWKDVGSVGNYFSTNRHVLGGVLSGSIGDGVFISRSAKISPPFIVGKGTHIGQGASVGPNTIIGSNCKVGGKSSVSGAIIHDSVKIGSGCRVESCIIGDRCELGDGVFVGSRAVLGTGCVVERNASISSNSIVGPIIKVQASTEVRGILSPNVEKINKVNALLDRLPAFKKLERNELQICTTLVEFGELGGDVLGAVSRIPEDQLDKSLTKLQELGIIRARDGSFSLLYEEPERISDWLRRHLL
jgi:mannose-1-phosphate guanylyltransferase